MSSGNWPPWVISDHSMIKRGGIGLVSALLLVAFTRPVAPAPNLRVRAEKQANSMRYPVGPGSPREKPKASVKPGSPEPLYRQVLPQIPVEPRPRELRAQQILQTPVKPEPQARKVLPQNKTRQFGHVSLNVSSGVEVTLGNRSTGRITVVGWDRDVISAKAVSQRGEEALILEQSTDGPEQRVFLKADYADLESSDHAGRVLDMPPIGDDGPIQVHLEVSLPRSATIELIRVMRSNVEISNVETPLTIVGEKSSVILKHIGPAEVHTRSGNIEIEDAKGLVEVTTTSGAIRVLHARSGVQAVSIAGAIEVRCARGRVDVTNTNAPIDLYNVGGDVNAIAANSSVRFASELQQDGRYYLRSMSGRVEMILAANTPGFNATLSSYRGIVESDFPLKRIQGNANKEMNPVGEKELTRRLNGKFGKGGPQIMLDSFEGYVRLTRTAKPDPTTCK